MANLPWHRYVYLVHVRLLKLGEIKEHHALCIPFLNSKNLLLTILITVTLTAPNSPPHPPSHRTNHGSRSMIQLHSYLLLLPPLPPSYVSLMHTSGMPQVTESASPSSSDVGAASRAVSGQDHPTEPDYLAISKLARATIASATLQRLPYAVHLLCTPLRAVVVEELKLQASAAA